MPQTSRLEWNGRAWLLRSKLAARDGTQKALEHILGESKKLVPLEEGTLERSGTVTMDPGIAAGGTISYDTVYAVRQHEELTWRHLPGRQAKYLEQPMLTERETALAIIAAEIRRRAFFGGRLG